MAHEDWMPTLAAAAGDPDVTQKLLKGLTVTNKTFKNHLDGYNFLPFFKGQEPKAPRREIFCFDDNTNLNALRIDDWKVSFKIMEGNIATGLVKQPNMPVVVNLRQDPFERYYGESQMYPRWAADKLWIFVPAQAVVGRFLQSFKEYPPSQRSGSFGVDQVLETLQTGAAGSGK